MKNKKDKNEIILLKELFQIAGFRMSALLGPAFLLAITAVFEGISMTALIPLANGILTGNFNIEHAALDWLQDRGFVFAINSPGKTMFVFLLLFIFVSVALKNIFQYAALVWSDFLGVRFVEKIRSLIFRRYLSFGKIFFDQHPLGRLLDINLGMTRQIQNTLTNVNRDLSLVLIVAAYLIIMFFISWWLTLLSMLLFPTLYYAAERLIQAIQENSKRESKLRIRFAGQLSNAISRITLIKAYNRESFESHSVDQLVQDSALWEEAGIKRQRLIPVIQEMLVIIGSLVLVSIAALFFRETEKIAELLVFFIILRRMAQCLLSIQRVRTSLASIGGVVKEIAWVFEDEDKIFVPEGTLSFDALKTEIEFRGLTYAYRQDFQVLKNINFKIKKENTVAIVGKTGSGKTTLTQLLMRFYDCEPGMIFIDGTDIRNFKINSLRKAIALVPQEPILFNDTLKNNLIYGLEEVPSSEELGRVLQKARLEDCVQSLPQGIDTLIGDRGVKLSGGEKQRVAIARAILKKSEILILDEATSALDSKTEKQIQEAIDEAVTGKTSIVIAHRLSTIRKADKIIVIEDGRIVEEGSLSGLLSEKGKFFDYWEEQRTMA